MRLRLAAIAVALPLACAPDSVSACASRSAPPELSERDPVDPAVRERVNELVLAVRTKPADADLREELARVYQANGLAALADATWAQLLELDPRRPIAWYLRGVVLAELGDLEGACAAAARAAELEPGQALPRWRRGVWLLDLGRPDEARAELDRACALDPADFRPRAALARAELFAEHPAEAATQARTALGLNPDDATTHNLLAAALEELGETEAAARERALAALAPAPPPDAWLRDMLEENLNPIRDVPRAQALLRTRGPLEAKPEIEALLLERPDHPGVLALAVELYGQLGSPEKGLALLESARQRVPGNPEIALLLGTALMRTGQVDRALSETAAAVRLSPDLGPARHQLGSLQATVGRLDEARLSFEEALQRGYREPTLLLELGVVQRRTGHEFEAVGSFEEVCARMPDLFEAHLYLARARGEIGDLAGAWKTYERAAELQASSPALAQVAGRLRALAAGMEKDRR
jgi:tetratricopeptide (TPR) repeat protein